MRCGDCRFWKVGSSGEYGVCRRYPSDQPLKHKVKWCGEFCPTERVVKAMLSEMWGIDFDVHTQGE